MNATIETEALTHRYRGGEVALEDLNLTVSEGSLYGLIGPNGAGKTTTLDILMNLLRPTSGEARILGFPSSRLGPKELASIGYVSSEQHLPIQRTVDQVLSYLAPLYPTWDEGFADQLLERLTLPRHSMLQKLSRGERMKAALVFAMAFRPRVMILDEPFSGLDAIVREELVEGILDPTQQEGWTVLASSHDLDGLEPLVDHVGILSCGRLILDASTEHLANHYRRVEAIFDDQATQPTPLPETWRAWQASGRTARFIDTAFTSDAALRHHLPTAQRLETSEVGLRDLFIALCRDPSLREESR